MKVFAQISVISTEFRISLLGFSKITKDLLISKLSTNLLPLLFYFAIQKHLFLKSPPILHTYFLLFPISSLVKSPGFPCPAGDSGLDHTVDNTNPKELQVWK